MDGASWNNLKLLVTGIDAAIARDIVRLAVAEGASVIAADADATKLAHLGRISRVQVETAHVDLANQDELRLWQGSLRASGCSPHLLICCCNSVACPPESANASARSARSDGASDVALTERRNHDCPAGLASAVLQPALFLHAEPMRRATFNRAISALRHPTLRGVLDRAPSGAAFSSEAAISYVRNATRPYPTRRRVDGQTAPHGRLRFTPPPARTARRDAA